MMLSGNETSLKGNFIFEKGKCIKDETSLRIEWLIENVLVKLGTDSSGWDSLYFDKAHNKFWELTFPHSEMHGGGPRELKLVTREEVVEKYPFLHEKFPELNG